MDKNNLLMYAIEGLEGRVKSLEEITKNRDFKDVDGVICEAIKKYKNEIEVLKYNRLCLAQEESRYKFITVSLYGYIFKNGVMIQEAEEKIRGHRINWI